RSFIISRSLTDKGILDSSYATLSSIVSKANLKNAVYPADYSVWISFYMIWISAYLQASLSFESGRPAHSQKVQEDKMEAVITWALPMLIKGVKAKDFPSWQRAH